MGEEGRRLDLRQTTLMKRLILLVTLGAFTLSSCSQTSCDKFVGEWIRDDESIGMKVSSNANDSYTIITQIIGTSNETPTSKWKCVGGKLKGEEGPKPLEFLYQVEGNYLEMEVPGVGLTRFYKSKSPLKWK